MNRQLGLFSLYCSKCKGEVHLNYYNDEVHCKCFEVMVSQFATGKIPIKAKRQWPCLSISTLLREQGLIDD